ncbi:MAG: C10 family peptidase [Sphingobacteriaceae bacterium]|nr:C10 family peptidase [Sphingobacteriaceae bacterium]
MKCWTSGFAKGGHFYLIDGYDASNKFHTNFGWSGTHNGYYAITSVTNAAGNFTKQFSQHQAYFRNS